MDISNAERFDLKREHKEPTEKQEDTEIKQAAAKERAEVLVEATKNSSTQMKNIAAHIAQVQNTIAQIRAALSLPNHPTDPSSIEQDKAQLLRLQKQIEQYRGELLSLKKEEIQKLHPEMDAPTLEKAAEEQIVALLKSVAL